MTEPELREETIKLCDQLRLLWHYCPSSRFCQGPKGFPDLFIAGPRGLMVPELKSADGDTTPQQDLWLWTLNQAFKIPYTAFSAPVLRPADWESGRIRRGLAALCE